LIYYFYFLRFSAKGVKNVENHFGGKCMICRFLLAALLLTGSAFAQTPPPVAATTTAAPPSVEAFASLPFVAVR
jgi:hypothetical protein